MRPTPPMPEVDSDDEYLPTADPDDLVWSKGPVPDSQEYLCIHLKPRPATTPPVIQSSRDVPGARTTSTATPQPDQVEMSQVPENMDIDILEDIPDLIMFLKKYHQTLMLGNTVYWSISSSVTFNEHMTFKVLDINEQYVYNNRYFYFLNYF